MNKQLKITVNADVYEKFCLSRKLSGDTEETAMENCMRCYIAKTFEKASQEYNPKTSEAGKDYFGKAIARIPVWALKPDQYNHKIIKAYFTAIDISGSATLAMMERLCSDKDHPALYVPTFRNNYSQMKMDGRQSHGKVFEDNGDEVWIWSEVEETLLRCKSGFYTDEM